MNHGVTEIMRHDLGNLSPIYERDSVKTSYNQNERELYKLDVHQVKRRRNVFRDGEGGKGCRHKYPEPMLTLRVSIQSDGQ